MKTINYFIQQYLENRPFFYTFIRPQEASLFDQNKRFIKPPILDFGCGDGFFAQIVFGNKKIDIGLDLENSRINEAKGIYKKLVVYDGVKIPYPDNYFQSVVSNCVLEHLPNIKLSLKEIYRVLRPHGYFITTVMTGKWEDYIFGKKIMRKIQQHQNLFSVSKWQTTFKKSGFKMEKSVGYLSPTAACYNEIFHFLSLPSLANYKLFGKWILCKNMLNSPAIINTIKKNINTSVKTSRSAAIFFVLQKSSPLDDHKQ